MWSKGKERFGGYTDSIAFSPAKNNWGDEPDFMAGNIDGILVVLSGLCNTFIEMQICSVMLQSLDKRLIMLAFLSTNPTLQTFSVSSAFHNWRL